MTVTRTARSAQPLVLVVGGLTVLATLAVPVLAANGHLVLGAWSAVATVVVLLTHARRAGHRRWLVAAGAVLALSLGQFLRASGTSDDVGEVALVVTQAALFAGYLALVPGPAGGIRRSELLDGAVVMVSVGVLFVVYAILPALESAGDLLSRIAVASIPVFDLAVLGVLTRTMAWPGRRSRAFWWLTASAGATLGGHAVALASGALGVPAPEWLVCCFVLATTLLAASATDTSAGALGRRPVVAITASTHLRLPVLGMAGLLPPAAVVVGQLTRAPNHALLLTVGSIVVLVLVLARAWTLLTLVRDQASLVARLADTDPLTGLPNRRSWDNEVAVRFAAAHLDGSPVTVAIVDLDHFKAYNDSRGHDGGDVLLQEAATAWRAALGGAFLARWGGEEFTVLFPGLTVEEALVALERVHAVVPDGQTCSIGVAGWDRSEVPPATLARADKALYRAKENGRNRSDQAVDADAPVAASVTATGSARAVG